ncbi:MAG: elongation factor P [Caldithrix sp.]|nr:elongation factor P [Caldithrix sp.]
MKIKASQIRKGTVIIYNDELYSVTDFTHLTPGKGQAAIQVKMKNVQSGSNAENKFRPDENVEKADMDTRKMEFLFRDDMHFYFMDLETFEQIPLDGDLLGDDAYYLLPNTQVDVSFHENTPIGIELPLTVELKVTSTEPNMKTATVTSSYKPAELETGLKTQIPPFIEEGELIRIDTRDGHYIERVK